MLTIGNNATSFEQSRLEAASFEDTQANKQCHHHFKSLISGNNETRNKNKQVNYPTTNSSIIVMKRINNIAKKRPLWTKLLKEGIKDD